MEHDLESRIQLLEKKSMGASFFSFLEKLLVPIALGLLAYAANSASINIAKSQNELARAKLKLADSQFQLAKAQDNRAALESESTTLRTIEESKTAKQLKYIELIYQDISSTDKNRQLQALGLLLSLDQEVGQALAKAVSSNPSNNKVVRDKALRILRSINKYGSLINYKIGIYIEEGDADLKSYAGKLVLAFTENRFPGHISIYVKAKEFFDKAKRLEFSHIRYEPGAEDDPAEMLISLLNIINPGRQFRLVKTIQPSPNFISIFPVGSPDDFSFNHEFETFQEFIPSSDAKDEYPDFSFPKIKPLPMPSELIMKVE